jgi:hypothetical protein
MLLSCILVNSIAENIVDSVYITHTLTNSILHCNIICTDMNPYYYFYPLSSAEDALDTSQQEIAPENENIMDWYGLLYGNNNVYDNTEYQNLYPHDYNNTLLQRQEWDGQGQGGMLQNTLGAYYTNMIVNVIDSGAYDDYIGQNMQNIISDLYRVLSGNVPQHSYGGIGARTFSASELNNLANQYLNQEEKDRLLSSVGRAITRILTRDIEQGVYDEQIVSSNTNQLLDIVHEDVVRFIDVVGDNDNSLLQTLSNRYRFLHS